VINCTGFAGSQVSAQVSDVTLVILMVLAPVAGLLVIQRLQQPEVISSLAWACTTASSVGSCR